MNILAISTSGPVAGCAILSEGKILQSISMNCGLVHSETIMPAVDFAMEKAGLRIQDVDLFAVDVGPGSFTGVRLGVCAAKGLAHAIGAKCFAVSSLEALAMNFYGADALICPILDARRDQVYTALFSCRNGFPARIWEDQAISVTELIDHLPKDCPVIFLGDGAQKHFPRLSEALGSIARIAPANLRDLRCDGICLLAEKAQQEAYLTPHALTPKYLRLSQAERERQARLKAEVQQ